MAIIWYLVMRVQFTMADRKAQPHTSAIKCARYQRSRAQTALYVILTNQRSLYLEPKRGVMI